MGRSPCCDKVGLKKGPWTPEEDRKLVAYVEQHGHGSWRALPAKAGLQRCGKSCRLRWTNYLRPDIKRGKFSLQEEQTIIQLHALLGNRWSAIATHLPRRTDNEIKNYWNTHLKKRLTKMGIDPVTHKPKSDALGPSHAKDTANLSHMAQWESARLEAEARLVRESKLVSPIPNSGNTPMQNQLASPSTLVHRAVAMRPLLPCLDVLRVWQGSWPKLTKEKPLSATSRILGSSFTADDLESPTSTLSFVDHTLPNPAATLAGSYLVGASMMSELKHRLLDGAATGVHDLTSYEAAEADWEENHTALAIDVTPITNIMDSLQDMFEFSAIDQGSSMGAAGDHGINDMDGIDDKDDNNNNNYNNNSTNENNNVSYVTEFEDNKNYWNSILNMVSPSPTDSSVF